MSTTLDISASKDIKKFVVRLSLQLRDDISSAAKQSHRSMNSEIINRLSMSFKYHPLSSEAESQGIQEARMRYTKISDSNLDALLIERIESLSNSKKLALLEILDNDTNSQAYSVS